MAYVLGASSDHPDPALKRLDHLICRVPDIERFHSHFINELGFSEAWPIGRFWPEGRTSGIALGGINLEFIQPNREAPKHAVTDTFVFEPTSISVAEKAFRRLGVQTRRFVKNESIRELLALRGFEGDELHSTQIICENLLLESAFPVPMFLCRYVPKLQKRLGANNPALGMPYGRVLSVECQLGQPGEIGRLSDFGYLGQVELVQLEDTFGEPKIRGIRMETGPVDLKGIDPGFRFI